MSGLIIGVLSGLVTIFIIRALRFLEEQLVYGLVLCAIGFLYVGFTWTDMFTVVISATQAIVFLLIAYFGMKHSFLLLAAGYFLHGTWDLIFSLWASSKLVPPHYDLFCMAIDFTMGFYLLLLNIELQNRLLCKMKLYIKNMVCPRCVSAVERVLQNIGAAPIDVRLGEVLLSEQLSAEQVVLLKDQLLPLGFELLDDSLKQQIDQIDHHHPYPLPGRQEIYFFGGAGG